MTPSHIKALFDSLAAANPHPAIELNYQTPYQLLVAVILSAQSTDKGVNRATVALFQAAPTPEAMAALGEDALIEHIRTIGLYRTKGRNIIRMTRQLLDKHGGAVPHDRVALESLPGVGRKSANVILNTIFGEPVIAVDTHIFRVANRTGLAPGKDVRAVESKLMEVVPKQYLHNAHHWLVLHGRYVCKAIKPHCAQCIIRNLCEIEKP
ncbi:MAG: endonuclease III [Rhodocyclaceae bacterium]|nr:endonuclease III [Rhodocyclaceae bacterium]